MADSCKLGRVDENVVAYLKLDAPEWTAHDLGESVDFVAWVRLDEEWDGGRGGNKIRAHFVIAEVNGRSIRVLADTHAPVMSWQVHKADALDGLDGTRVLAEAEVFAWGSVKWDGSVNVCFDTEDGAHSTDRQGLVNIGVALAMAHDLCLDAMEASGTDVSEGRRWGKLTAAAAASKP
jgi:hypothetical protein